MLLRSALVNGWILFRLLVVCAGIFGISPSIPDFSNQAIAGDLQCAPVQNACGCATCGCSTPQRPSCPAGQTLYDDYCLPSCPEGFIRYPGMPGLCLPPCHHGCPTGYDQIPLPQCPDGFHRDLNDIDLCVQDPGVRDYQGQCPVGMSYAPETGQCEVNCPSGMFRNERGLCESYYQRECPEGFGRDPESGKCLPAGTWPVGHQWICMPQCPSGTVRDIQHPSRCIPTRPECPQGFENLQGRCLPICEQGTTRDNYGYCVPTNDCPEGTYLNSRGQCVENKCPEGFEQIRGQCVPPCEEGWQRNRDGRCEPPQQTCADNEEIYRGQCVPVCKQGLIRDENGRCTPPQQGCDDNEELFRGQCVPVCKQGLKRDNNGRCVPPVKTCPEGQRLNPQSNQCERIKVCPKNTVYDAKRNKCLPRQPEQPKCDQGEVLDRNGRCVPIRQQPQCDQGEILDRNGRCVPIRIVPRGCDEGFYLDRKSGRCLPVRQPEPEPRPIDPGRVIIEKVPGLLLQPGVIDKLIPRDQGDDNNVRRSDNCPQGTVMDKNGRCREAQ